MIKIKSIFSFLILSIFLTVPFSYADAATVSLIPSVSEVSVGNIVSVRVVVNTQGVYINNGEAVVQFPTDLLEVVSISKSASIFSMWVEEPSFSNSTGRVTFNGGVANPGFAGNSGTMATITFKAKKAGSASLIFFDAAIRENDGLGTNVLSTKNSSLIKIGTATPQVVAPTTPTVTPSETSPTVPKKPVILSSTHPDQGSWQKLDKASFSWTVPSGVTSIQASMSKSATGTPNITYDNSVTQKTITDIDEGVSYFHLRYRNSVGWSPVAHYQINVDNTSPLSFNPKIRNVENQNFIKLDAEDAVSGISHYILQVDDLPSIKVKKSELVEEEYLLPVFSQGSHTLVVSAYDKAGNHTEATLEFESSFISSPSISLNLEQINKGEAVVIFGKTDYPNSKVEVILEFEGKLIKKYTETTMADGSFSLTTDRIKTVGVIEIWAENIFNDQVKSKPSPKVFLKVNEAEIVKVTIAVFWLIILLILVMILMFITYVGWHKFFGLKKKINMELEKTREESHKAMLLFKEELNEQLRVLEKAKVDRTLNKKEEAIFAEIQRNVDHIDDFIEKKFKKIM